MSQLDAGQQIDIEADSTQAIAAALNGGAAQIIAITTTIAAALAAWLAGSGGGMVAWIICGWLVAVGLIRLWLYIDYHRHGLGSTNAGREVNVAVGAQAAQGLGWAGLIITQWNNPVGSPLLMASVMVALLTLQLATLSASVTASLALALPVLVALSWQLFNDSIINLVTALLVILPGVAALAFFLSRRRDLLDAISVRQQKPEWLATIGHAEQKATERMLELDQLRQERDEARGQIGAAKREAESAAMAKDEFLATMSHEIRTPLNGIMPLLDLLRGTQLDEAQRDYLNTAFLSSKHLLSIIDNILDYSKVEAGKLELEVVGLNLRELLDSVSKMMSGSAQRKGLELRTKLDPSVRLAMRGDPVRLRQILTNLVSNAIKFTDRGFVEISIEKKSESRDQVDLLFMVRDTGIGMDEAARNRLFKPFAQADASTTRNYGGTGLGLAICKRLTDVMDGEIGVDSEPGRGSTFWFSVPLKKSIGDIEQEIDQLANRRLLLVSDGADMTRRIGAFAERWGSKLDTATNVNVAVGQIKQARSRGENWAYAAALIDTASVGRQGLALAKSICQAPKLKLSCLLLTNTGRVPAVLEDHQELRAVGLDAPEAVLHERLESLLAFNDEAASTEERSDSYRAGSDDDSISAHILLVEDNPINLHVAEKLLSTIGVEFSVAKNGKEAINQLNQGEFDAVFMDCMMPVMDGYTATQEWRQNELQRGVERLPIIAMTANAMAGDRERCLDSGMDDYMSKPLNRKVMVEMLRRWTGEERQRSVALSPAGSAVIADPMPVAQPAPAGSQPVLDDDILGELAEVMEDELQELVDVFLNDAPGRIDTIERAAKEKNAEPLVEIAHSLKSTSANLGGLQVSEVSRQIEEAAKLGMLDQAIAAAANLRPAYEELVTELNAFMAGR